MGPSLILEFYPGFLAGHGKTDKEHSSFADMAAGMNMNTSIAAKRSNHGNLVTTASVFFREKSNRDGCWKSCFFLREEFTLSPM